MPSQPADGWEPLVAEVREYVRERTGWTSLRTVAREVPMSHATLHMFVHGKKPHPRTWSHLRDWYMREHGDGRPARIALDVLSRSFPESQREQVRLDLLDTMERAYTSRGVSPPAWLTSHRTRERC